MLPSGVVNTSMAGVLESAPEVDAAATPLAAAHATLASDAMMSSPPAAMMSSPPLALPPMLLGTPPASSVSAPPWYGVATLPATLMSAVRTRRSAAPAPVVGSGVAMASSMPPFSRHRCTAVAPLAAPPAAAAAAAAAAPPPTAAGSRPKMAANVSAPATPPGTLSLYPVPTFTSTRAASTYVYRCAPSVTREDGTNDDAPRTASASSVGATAHDAVNVSPDGTTRLDAVTPRAILVSVCRLAGTPTATLPLLPLAPPPLTLICVSSTRTTASTSFSVPFASASAISAASDVALASAITAPSVPAAPALASTDAKFSSSAATGASMARSAPPASSCGANPAITSPSRRSGATHSSGWLLAASARNAKMACTPSATAGASGARSLPSSSSSLSSPPLPPFLARASFSESISMDSRRSRAARVSSLSTISDVDSTCCRRCNRICASVVMAGRSPSALPSVRMP